MQQITAATAARAGVDLATRVIQVPAVDAAVVSAHKSMDRLSLGLVQLTARVGWQKAVVARVSKNARTLWAVLAKGRRFDPDHVSGKPEGSATAVPAMSA